MQEPTGYVTMNERPPTQRFHRFVEEQIRDWMRENNFSGLGSEFEVAFFDEDSLGEVSCLVVIQSGSHLLRAWETADNARLALTRSLDHLKEESDEVSLASEDSANPSRNENLKTHH